MGILLAFILIAALILRGAKNNTAPPVADITLCDQNPRELCIVTFGADEPARMMINFQLPKADFPVFNVKGVNRGITYDYSCYTTETGSTSVYCTGPRTPLGEYIELEVYSVEENFLLARGKIFVSAVIVWTPAGITNTPSANGTPAATSGTGTAGTTQASVTPSPTQTRITPRPGTAYPNPPRPLPGTAYPNP